MRGNIVIKLNYYNCIRDRGRGGGGKVGILVGYALGNKVYIFWALNTLLYHYKIERQYPIKQLS